MKFVLFLVCAIVAVQGHSVHPVKKAPTKDIDDVIQIIRAIIERISQIINEIQNNLPEIINSIRDKINEIVAQLPDIIQEIRDRIQAIVEQGEVAKQCVEAQREQLENVAQQAEEGVRACIQAAEGQADALLKELQALIATAESVSRDIMNRVATCVRDNPLNPVAIANCLQGELDGIRQQLKELEVQVKAVIEAARDVAQNAGQELRQCVANVREQIAPQEQAIINDIKQCIQQN